MISKKVYLQIELELLTNDFFVNLLDMNIVWNAINEDEEEFEGKQELVVSKIYSK